MNKTEIAKLIDRPFPEIAEACKNPDTLATILHLVLQTGIQIGRTQTHESYNELFRNHHLYIGTS